MKENESCHEIQDEVIKIEEQLGREAENYLVEVQEKCKNFSDLMWSMNVLYVWKNLNKS